LKLFFWLLDGEGINAGAGDAFTYRNWKNSNHWIKI